MFLGAYVLWLYCMWSQPALISCLSCLLQVVASVVHERLVGVDSAIKVGGLLLLLGVCGHCFCLPI